MIEHELHCCFGCELVDVRSRLRFDYLFASLMISKEPICLIILRYQVSVPWPSYGSYALDDNLAWKDYRLDCFDVH